MTARAGRPPLAQDVRASVLELRTAGRSWAAIAQQLGIGRSTAWYAVHGRDGHGHPAVKPQGDQVR